MYLGSTLVLVSVVVGSETKALARAGLRNPATVSVAVKSKGSGGEAGGAGMGGHKTQATPSSLENFYIVCEPEEKLAQLVGFLKVHDGILPGCRENDDSVLNLNWFHVQVRVSIPSAA